MDVVTEVVSRPHRNRTIPPGFFGVFKPMEIDEDDEQEQTADEANTSAAIASGSRQKTKAEKAREKRQAKQEAEKQRRAAKRRLDPEAEPCSACGNWDHERRSSKSCPYYLPPRKGLTPLTRTSVIKTGLNNCCPNDRLKQIIQETVITSRNLTYVASLFMEYLVVNRLSNNLPIPPLNQTFCYNVFCQLINRGSRAPDWNFSLYE
ncbi:hypothetical protein Unana1_02923 [Umbelopsis nana]